MQGPDTYHWTYEDYLALPDDGTRCEIIEGERLMTPAPWTRHQQAVGWLFANLYRFVAERGLGRAFVAPYDVVLADDTVVQPDVMVLTREREERMKESGLFGAPDLAIEVLSPSSGHRDRVRKLRVYARHGVREYWIVDPELRRVEIHVLDHGRLVLKAEHSDGEARSLVVVPGFSAPLADLFRA